MTESSTWVSMNDIFAAEETKLRKEREARESQKEKKASPKEGSRGGQAATADQSDAPSPTIPNQHHPQPTPTVNREEAAPEAPSAARQASVPTAPSVIAPQRDFNRRANSIERDALPSGLFPGSSKKLYDAVYARTRGAVTPRLEIQATKRDLMAWSGIRNIKTIETHVRHLVTVGLMTRRGENGDSAGFHYGIRLPEEVGQTPSPSPTIPNQHGDPPSGTIPDQKMVMGGGQKTVVDGEGQSVENNSGLASGKTLSKTSTVDDDEHTLTEFANTIWQTACEVCACEYPLSDQERERWRELALVLSDELRSAARRAETISSAPAFFAAHLRRRFGRKARSSAAVGDASPSAPERDAANRKGEKDQASRRGSKREQDDGGSADRANGKSAGAAGGSRFRMEECFRFAKHLYDTRQGINNPGGYATTIFRTGEADDLIEMFLHPPEPPPQLNIDDCPDCRGSGFWYPQGTAHGVARCRHERLTSQSHAARGTCPERRLPPEEIEEQAGLFIHMLESGYTVERLTEQFAAGVHPEDWRAIMEMVEGRTNEKSV